MTIQTSSKGTRTLIGAAAASLGLLGGALLWQMRPISETAAPMTPTSIGRVSEDVARMDGLAALYRDQLASGRSAR